MSEALLFLSTWVKDHLLSVPAQIRALAAVWADKWLLKLAWCLMLTPIIIEPFIDWEQYQIIAIEISQLLITCGLSIAGSIICPYERIHSKVGFFGCSIIFTFALFHYFIYWIWSIHFYYFAVYVFSILIVQYLIRARFMTKIPYTEYDPDMKTDWYGLIPIHSFNGLWQSVLFPWNMIRYESRIIRIDDDVYFIRKNIFFKTKYQLIDKASDLQVVWIPLKRKFIPREKKQLEQMIGQKVIFGIRDCRQLLVAGPVSKYIQQRR